MYKVLATLLLNQRLRSISTTASQVHALERAGLSYDRLTPPSQMRATLPFSVYFFLIFWSSLNLSCLILSWALYAAFFAFIRLR